MKNLAFIVAGLTIVVLILVSTLVHGPQPAVTETPTETPVEEPLDSDPVTPNPNEPIEDPEPVSEVQVFFGNTEQDPNTERCGEVYAVERDINPTPAVAKEALDQLLEGVTAEEKQAGYFSNLNSGARVDSIVVENGVATVVFTEEFATGMAGSCKVTMMRAQIENTLKQFDTVEEIVIKIIGVPDEEVLQP